MTDPIAVPYPTDTRAKGWRFDLDYEQIEQSSTWSLAGNEGRPWLLMLWFTAWRQLPCASLPNDEEVIAAMIGMPEKAWQRNRKVMLRGWALAEDGRLYHNVLTVRVLEMLSKRKGETLRKAAYRHGTPPLSRGTDVGLPRDGQGTPIAVPQDSTRKATPSPSPTEEKKNPPTPRKRGSAPDGFEDFYTPYPRKDARAKAESAWRSLNPSPELAAVIVADVKRKAAAEDWRKENGRYVPLPASYLNGKRWEDGGVRLPAPDSPGASEPLNAPTYKSRDWGHENPMEIAK